MRVEKLKLLAPSERRMYLRHAAAGLTLVALEERIMSSERLTPHCPCLAEREAGTRQRTVSVDEQSDGTQLAMPLPLPFISHNCPAVPSVHLGGLRIVLL